jgi:hypothetical protein
LLLGSDRGVRALSVADETELRRAEAAGRVLGPAATDRRLEVSNDRGRMIVFGKVAEGSRDSRGRWFPAVT